MNMVRCSEGLHIWHAELGKVPRRDRWQCADSGLNAVAEWHLVAHIAAHIVPLSQKVAEGSLKVGDAVFVAQLREQNLLAVGTTSNFDSIVSNWPWLLPWLV